MDVTTHNQREECLVRLANLKIKDAERQANAGYSITEETLSRLYNMIEDMFFLEMLNSEQYQIISMHFEKFRLEMIQKRDINKKKFKVGHLE
ncbi:MAG: hypothetical protein PUG60_05945 [Lachnospiraceae bacterium]|nr:hypothetical protein [Lachnospiraceae bacterium]MDY4968694.1 hypothetical protein [Lachnospiraceae bacterium]